MPLATTFSNLFGRSPIKPMQEHMAAAVNAANGLVPFFAAVIANDWEKAEAAQQQINDLEHQADDIKQQIRLHLPNSLFLPVP